MNVSRKRIRDKVVAPLVDVYAVLDEGPVLAGHLDLAESDDFQARFTYADSWIEAARAGQAFALDPINLPLTARPYVASHRDHLLGALFDATPDAWGRTLMALSEGTPGHALPEGRVLSLGKGSGLGALVFSPPGTVPALEPLDLPGLDDLPALYQAAQAVIAGGRAEPQGLQRLVRSWDMGGARPKAVVRDKAGVEWVAKFPRGRESYSRQRVEWANLEMARAIGMTVPQTEIVELGDGEAALLVRRFDREPGVKRRLHALSAVSLISPPATFDMRQMDMARGASLHSYGRVAEITRHISVRFSRDMGELFARMVFNVLVRNTDDHARNHAFVRSGDGFRLAPLFDVVTQPGHGRHSLHIGPGVGEQRWEGELGRIGSLANALAGGRQWGLKLDGMHLLLERVQKVLANRRTYYAASGMDAAQMETVEQLSLIHI